MINYHLLLACFCTTSFGTCLLVNVLHYALLAICTFAFWLLAICTSFLLAFSILHCNTFNTVIRFFRSFPGVDPDYIHLCKCWSHICSCKVIKKIPEYPRSPTNYFIIFFCQSKRLKPLRSRYAVCKICRMSLHVCHALKTVFPGNIWKFSNIQENL